jgi:cell division protein FtsI/penicillin-binding protein 2
VAVIDRRIGVLFAAFMALLAIALTRATYLGTLKAGKLRADAAAQQVKTVPVPAARVSSPTRAGARSPSPRRPTTSSPTRT